MLSIVLSPTDVPAAFLGAGTVAVFWNMAIPLKLWYKSLHLYPVTLNQPPSRLSSAPSGERRQQALTISGKSVSGPATLQDTGEPAEVCES